MNYRVVRRDETGRRKWIRFEATGSGKSTFIMRREGGLTNVFGLKWAEVQRGTEVEIRASKYAFDELIK